MIYRAAFALSQRWLVHQRNKYLAARLASDMNIADLGSGGNPFRAANVLIDRFDSGDVQRGGRRLLRPKGRDIRDIDLNRHPFPLKTKEFDFVLTNHLLEHLDDPVGACRELSRIAKAGYIEVPNPASDVFMRPNDIIHKWLCFYDPAQQVLFFLDRRAALERTQPGRLPIWTRFFLSLRVTRLIWEDHVRGEYLASESWI